jgi:hypothetical protein
MSPEQVLGGSLDHRSDMFSLGVLLHELATGVHPFLRADAADTMAAILRDPPSSGLRDVTSVPGLDVLLQRMLAKASSERLQTMSELRLELEALRERVSLAASPSQTAVGAVVERSERTPFVGREAEATELRRLLDRMLTGHGDVALVGGEPGIGKTRLARELMREARQRGCLCLTGHCDEMAGAPPFAPFIETMEEAVRVVPQAVRQALGDVAPEIATIVPSLRRAFPTLRRRRSCRPTSNAGSCSVRTWTTSGARRRRRQWLSCSMICTGPTNRRYSSSGMSRRTWHPCACSSLARIATSSWT